MRDSFKLWWERKGRFIVPGEEGKTLASAAFDAAIEECMRWQGCAPRPGASKLDDCTVGELKRMGAVAKAQWPDDSGYHQVIDSSITSITDAFSAIRRCIGPLSKEAWIEKYGGQALLDRERFDVVPCHCTDDAACRGWRVESWKLDDPRRGVKA